MKGEWELPPLPDAEAFAKVRASLKRMTPEQQRASLVSAGIYNPDGTLTPQYSEVFQAVEETTRVISETAAAASDVAAAFAQPVDLGASRLCGVKRADGAPCTLGAGHADHSYAGSRFQAAPSASGCGCNCCSGCSNVLQVLANMGHDTTCGACMSQAFTGSDGGHAHSCARG